ncbi:Flp pilus assembly protein CpaB [Parasalinivibrio latis]|uniref:Flp pilus assembly protein CpaB n=1 Tax=Parasalinivibrio latis TaxID=2952610 RepID=UPI0030E223F8
MNSKAIFLFAFIAIFAGAFTLFATEDEPEVKPVAVPPEPKVNMWIAGAEIDIAEHITHENFDLIIVPLSEAQSHGISASYELNIPEGSISKSKIMPGETVTQNHVVTPNSSEYIDLVIKPEMVPFPLAINNPSVTLTTLSPGDFVDVVILTSSEKNVVQDRMRSAFRSLEVSPLLIEKRVLAVKKVVSDENNTLQSASVLLELSRADVAKMIIAQRVGEVELFKSSSPEAASQSRAATRDVLAGYHAVKELRGTQRPKEL